MKKRKGFTLVELLVVIAILAILATVSVIGYIGFTDKAKESNDISLTTQLNNVLQAEEVVSEKPSEIKEVIDILDDNGFDIIKLTPTKDGNYYLWDQISNRFVYCNSKLEVVHKSSDTNIDIARYWVITSSQSLANKFIATDKGYTVYVTANITAPVDGYNLSGLYGLYIADNYTLTGDVSYENSTLEVESNLVVSGTILGSLSINDVDATVHHYGKINNVLITSVANESYHEHGEVKDNIEITAGRVALSSTSSVPVIKVSSSATDVKVYVSEVQSAPIVKVETTTASAVQIKTEIPTQSICIVAEENVLTSDSTTNIIAPFKVSSEEQLKAALNSASQEIFITLEADITKSNTTAFTLVKDKIFTLDLNGHFIKENDYDAKRETADSSYKGTYVFTTNGECSLIISDSSVERNGSIYSTRGVLSALNKRLYEFRVNGGNFYSIARTAGTCLMISADKVVINDCVVKATNYALYVQSDDATINGGTFISISNNSFGMSDWAYAVKVDSKNIVINYITIYGVQGGLALTAGTECTINKGHIEASLKAYELYDSSLSTSGLEDKVYHALYMGEENAKCVVNDGTFVSTTQATVSFVGSNISYASNLTINNGNFVATGNTVNLWAGSKGTIKVNGGIYTNSVIKVTDK